MNFNVIDESRVLVQRDEDEKLKEKGSVARSAHLRG